ncbi:hypothetical protein [Sulfurimonas sediminis]|uniref:hypothetical protein n=1 Tax=Sulfurimonas sediminis TaxID=2590020 RepID=UPI00186858D3|nr:hypothetical protein [Sulfurimonas sediminis]
MNKNPINKKIISKIVIISQAIEGYSTPNDSVIKKAQSLREKYGIKASVSR